MKEKKSLSDLDKNFAQSSLGDGWIWHRADSLSLKGKGWKNTSHPFHRLPDKAEGVVRPPVWELSRHPAGLYLEFETDAPSLAARWTLRQEPGLAEQMPATAIGGIDLYGWTGDGWKWSATGLYHSWSANESLFFEKLSKKKRRFRLYLPLYSQLDELEIGIPEGSQIGKGSSREQKRICVYGTSIVQGGCASRPGLAYPAILGRDLDVEMINLGFSGNARMEPELAELLGEVDASLFILDPVPNMPPNEVQSRYLPFVESLLEKRPEATILLVEQMPPMDGWLKPEKAEIVAAKNQFLHEVFADLKIRFPDRIHLVDTQEILKDGDATTDGLHLNDIGFRAIADAIHKAIKLLPQTRLPL